MRPRMRNPENYRHTVTRCGDPLVENRRSPDGLPEALSFRHFMTAV
jgi:hypothetical protein